MFTIKHLVEVSLSPRLSDQVDKLIELLGESADTTALEGELAKVNKTNAALAGAVTQNS